MHDRVTDVMAAACAARGVPPPPSRAAWRVANRTEQHSHTTVFDLPGPHPVRWRFGPFGALLFFGVYQRMDDASHRLMPPSHPSHQRRVAQLFEEVRHGQRPPQAAHDRDAGSATIPFPIPSSTSNYL